MYRFVFILLSLVLSVHSVSAEESGGNKLLDILGEDRNSEAVKKFRTEYILDKTLKNPILGIKLSATHDSGSVVTAVTVTCAGYEINDIKYKQFTGVLPFDMSFVDDEASLVKKFDITKKESDDDIRLKFKKDGITVSVYFKNANKKKILYIKFTQNVGSVGPYRSEEHEAPAASVDVAPADEPAKSIVKQDKLKSEPVAVSVKPVTEPAKNNIKPGNSKPDDHVTPLPTAAADSKAIPAKENKPDDPFYKSIMSVIESGEEEMFKDIKKDAATKANFWNYKYTYSTSVSIPGEKYNMLYSFPFQSSQLDFVSVLEETNGPSPAIKTKYTEVEAKLKEYFNPSDGWTYSYTVNTEDPTGLKDLELKNPKLGSIVLDYSINPYGKRVLYLRFLLQYT